MTVSQGKLIAISAPHQQQRCDQHDGAAEHRQGVRPHETCLHPSEATRCAADKRREAVDEAVKSPIVEEHEQPGEVLARPHEHRLVERVAQQVAPSGDDERPRDGRDRRHATSSVLQVRDADTDQHDDEGQDANQADRLERGVFGLADDRREEVGEPAAQHEEIAQSDGSDGENHHRPLHDLRRLVRVGVLDPTLLAEERHQHDASHVVRGEDDANERRGAEEVTRGAALVVRRLDDGVLGEPPGQPWKADDGEVTEAEGGEGPRHVLAEPAKATHVDLVVHAVHDRARAEEESGLEEAVGQQVRDAERVTGRAEPDCQHHVADLAHSGSGQRLLDVVLGAADDRAEQQCDGANDGHREPRRRRDVEDGRRPRDEVDTGGDHRRGMDERGDRRRAFHRVAEPGLQRHLRGLRARAEQQQQADRGHCRVVGATCGAEDIGEGEAAERREHQHDGERQAEVADSVDDERLCRGCSRRRLVVPEADEQVRRQADAFPPDVKRQVVIGQDKQQHRRHEKVHVREEPSPSGVVRHVADGVDVNQRTDPGDEQHERN
jgi:hypothetical protein